MKKKIALFLAMAIAVMSLGISALAAPAKFTDEIVDGFPTADSWSPKMYYQYNEDTEKTILVKQADSVGGKYDSTKTEFIAYKMEGNITGFSLDCMLCNGLGNADTDIKVYVSADKSNWKQVATKSTEPVFDDEIYIDYDHAYWVNSTISNKEAVPAGNSYIKIEFQPFTVKGSVPWNTVIDTVNIDFDKSVAPAPAPEQPVDSKPESQIESQTESQAESVIESAEESAVDSEEESSVKSENESQEADNKESKPEKKDNTVLIVVLSLLGVVIVAAAVAVITVKSRNKNK